MANIGQKFNRYSQETKLAVVKEFIEKGLTECTGQENFSVDACITKSSILSYSFATDINSCRFSSLSARSSPLYCCLNHS